MKVKRCFPIFNSHLDLAKSWWKPLFQEGDWAIDATCGNGNDTLALCQMYSGVIGLDLQLEAIESTQALLRHHGVSAQLYCQSHCQFPEIAYQVPIRLIVYNLGYLPGGNKALTTMVESTMSSIQEALKIVSAGGAVSITCYPGHDEGAKEAQKILEMVKGLDPALWSVSTHTWINRRNSPFLLLIQKNH